MRRYSDYINEKLSESNINLLAKHIYNELYGLAANNFLDDETVLEISFKDIKGFDPTRYKLIRPARSISTKDMLVIFDAEGDTFGYMIAADATLCLNYKFFKTVDKMVRHQTIIMNTLLHELTHYVQFSVGEKRGLRYAIGIDSFDKDIEKAMKQGIKGEIKNYYILSFFIYAFDKTEMDARRTGMIANLEADWNDKRFSRFIANKKNNEDTFVDKVLNNTKYNNNELHLQVFDTVIDRISKDTWDKYYNAYGSEDPYVEDSPIYCICNMFDHLKDPNDLHDYSVSIPLPAKNNFAASINTEEKFNKYKDRLLKHCNKQMHYYRKKLTKIIKQFYREKSEA